MKIKTSVSISKKAHDAVQRIARKQDRSVSYILEKFIEDCATQLKEPPQKKTSARSWTGARAPSSSLSFATA